MYSSFSTHLVRPIKAENPDNQVIIRVYSYPDPVRFDKDLKVTIQDLGWRHDGRYNNQKSDISSTTFWYQAEPHAKFPALPSKDDLEIPRW